MKKHKTREEGINWFNKYENGNINGREYYGSTYKTKVVSEARYKYARTLQKRINQAKYRFIRKYNEGKISDNTFMKKRKSKKEIDDFINNLTEEEKKIIIREHIRQNEKKKSVSKYGDISISKQAFIKNVHRTTLYKKQKQRIYKFDGAKSRVVEIFNESRMIYGSTRISEVLKSEGIYFNPRTLRRYMVRGNIITKTRKARKKAERKNVSVQYKDIVERNFNPQKDNIIATDVSYIPARVKQNNLYLSVAISHKTKMIESGKISNHNNNQLVIDTLNGLRRSDEFILHSDHGSQYSSNTVKSEAKVKYITSMGRVGNSLDNREVEYFFGCIKGEYLKGLKTGKMSPHEIERHIDGYINGYNTKRIQIRLQGKTPAEASAYAI